MVENSLGEMTFKLGLQPLFPCRSARTSRQDVCAQVQSRDYTIKSRRYMSEDSRHVIGTIKRSSPRLTIRTSSKP